MSSPFQATRNYFRNLPKRFALWWIYAKDGLIIALLIIGFVFAYFWHDIVHTIGSGEAGVRWSRFEGGTVTDKTYTEGIHAIFPWDRFYIYNVRIQEVTSKALLYTERGLALNVEVQLRFLPRLDELPQLHQRIGPDYIEKVIRPELISSVRKVLGNYTAEEIYALDEKGMLEDLRTTLTSDMPGNYIEISELLLTRLELPQGIQEAIQLKLREEQLALAYTYILQQAEQDRERRIIEADGIRAFEANSGVPFLRFAGIEATRELATSPNSKLIVVGNDESELPVLFSRDPEEDSEGNTP